MRVMREYQEADKYITDLASHTSKHSIKRVRQFLDQLGAPDRAGYRIIHVAGTDGKGSITCYLSSVMREAGFHVGVFTSPHLISLRERFAMDGELISEEEFVRVVRRVRQGLACDESATASDGDGAQADLPTYFEFLFLCAMIWFSEKKPDVVILEAGMGGLSDATNAVRHTDLSVITRIAMDHMQYLGDTIATIAAQKAGILRNGTPCVCLSDPEAAFSVIQNRSKEAGSPLYCLLPEGFSCRLMRGSDGAESIDFSYRRQYDGKGEISARLRSPAIYQAENAALVCLSLEAILREHIFRGDPREERLQGRAIIQGLESAKWQGRMEEILPHFYVDGAHNPAAAAALRQSVEARSAFDDREPVLLFSAVRDKEYEKELRILCRGGLFRHIILCPMDAEATHERAADLTSLVAAAKRAMKEQLPAIHAAEDLEGAVRCAISLITIEHAVIYAAGSLYFAGMVMTAVKGMVS